MTLDAFRYTFSRPVQWREFVEQSWFIARVSMIPTVVAAVTSTVLVSFNLNILLRESVVSDHSGASAASGTLSQVSPMDTVLIVAGGGATGICADLGARTIREEIAAMEVLGIDPVKRLVIPRMWASMLVAMLLNAMVTTIGIFGGFVFS